MKLAIIILNYNGKRDTLECLKTVEDLETPSLVTRIKKIVVDNASQDGSLQLIRKKFPKIELIVNKKNLGFAQGNNIGIQWALKKDYDYFLLLNNDTLVDKSLLIHLFKVIKKDKKIAITVPKIYFAPGYEYHRDRYTPEERGRVIWYAGGRIDWQNVLAFHHGVDQVDKGQFNRLEETNFASGCCFLIKRKVLKKVGLFDQRYFLYLEDVDLCQRVKEAGFKIVFVPQAKVWHKNAGSSKVGGGLHDYYLTRNRFLFGMKFASLRTKISLFKDGVRILFKGREEQKKGARDFFLYQWGKRKSQKKD